MKKFFYIFKSARKYWIYAFLTPTMMMAEAILELQIPGQISKLVDYLSSTSAANLEIKQVLIYGLYLLGFSLLSLIAGVLGGIFAAIGSSGFAKNLKDDMFKKIQTFSFKNIDKYSSSSLITRMTTDSNWMQMCFQMSIRMLFRSPTIFVYALIKAARISTKLSIIYLVAIPIIVAGLTIIFMKAHPYFGKGIRRIDDLNQVVEEDVRGIRVVKSFTTEKEQIKKFDDVNNDIYKFFSKASKIVNLNGPLMMFAIYTVIILIALFGTELIGSGSMTTGELYEMITYATNVLTALMMLSMVLVMFIIAKPSSERIYEVMKEEPTIKNPTNPVLSVKDGSVSFDHVSFKYNIDSDKFVLNDINLSIPSGATVGILGATGSAKTTLISMIARLYDVSSGSVKVGGVDVKDYDVKVLRDNVAVVLQKNVLFSGTIKDNLRWGNENASDEEIIQASKIAEADSFVMQRPNGYDTLVEQGGSNVSGGQKQRLCIARALLKNPKVLILDDSMSAVDTKTDAMIRAGLKEYHPSITKIIVAQRCASVMNADMIIIMDDGKISATGTHEELLRTSPIYQDVYYSQNREAAHEKAESKA